MENPCHGAEEEKGTGVRAISQQSRKKELLGQPLAMLALGRGLGMAQFRSLNIQWGIYAAFALTDAAPRLALMWIRASSKNRICKGGSGIASFFYQGYACRHQWFSLYRQVVIKLNLVWRTWRTWLRTIVGYRRVPTDLTCCQSASHKSTAQWGLVQAAVSVCVFQFHHFMPSNMYIPK